MVSRAFCGITIGLPVAKPNKVLSRVYVTNQEGVARPVPPALGRLLDFFGGRGIVISDKYKEI